MVLWCPMGQNTAQVRVAGEVWPGWGVVVTCNMAGATAGTPHRDDLPGGSTGVSL